MSTAIGALAAALVWICAPLISTGAPEVTRLLRLGALTLPAVLSVGAIRGVASGLNLWRLVNAEKLFTNGSRLLACLLFFVLHSLTLPAAVWIYLGCPVLGGLTYLRLSGRLSSERTEPLPWADSRSKNTVLLAYGAKTWIGALTGVVLSRVDQILMAPLAGARELGFYAAAVAIGEIPYVVSGATRDVMLAADAADPDDRRAQQASRATLFVTAAVCLLLAALSPVLIRFAFGAEFAPATPMLVVLLIAAFLYTPGSSAGAVLMARGRPGARSSAIATACVLNLAVLPLFIAHGGGIGASWASVIGYGGMSCLAVGLACRHFGWAWTALWRPTADDARNLCGFLSRPGRSAVRACDGHERGSA
jgi:O-antigen/teichoic acid export membrane protein